MMMSSGLISIAITLFLLVVAPLWIGAHYLTRWRQARAMTPEDERRLFDLWEVAERLERRMDAIERILEVEDAPAERGGRGREDGLHQDDRPKHKHPGYDDDRLR